MAWRKMEQKAEAKNVEVDEGPQPDTTSSTHQEDNDEGLDELPARRLLHKGFILFSVLTGLVALWMAVGQIIGILIQDSGPVQYALRGYVVLFSVLVILVELEWTRFTRESPVLHNWISRGLVYAFLGVIGMQENDTAQTQTAVLLDEKTEAYEILSDIVKAVAWNMAGCGVVYFVMGICCLQLVLERLRKGYQARLERAKKREQQHESGGSDSGSFEDVEAQELTAGSTADDKDNAQESFEGSDSKDNEEPKIDKKESLEGLDSESKEPTTDEKGEAEESSLGSESAIDDKEDGNVKSGESSDGLSKDQGSESSGVSRVSGGEIV